MSIWIGDKRLDSAGIIRSGHNIGDIFYTKRTDTGLAGAVECNGGTYSTADYTGAGSIGELLAGGKLDYISLTDYATAISTKGYCDKIGWDGTGTTSFRVPKLAPKRHVVKVQEPTADNNYTWYRLYNDGWVEQGGRVGPYSHTFNGSYSTSYSPTTVSFPIEMQDTRFYKTATSMHANVFASIYDQTTTDAKIGLGSVNVALSGIYATWEVIGQSAIVSDPTERAMIQLASGATDEALEVCTQVLADVADLKDMHNVTATGKETVVGWGMPDFDTSVSVSALPFTAPYDCYVFICAQRSGSTSSEGFITVNGITVLPFNNVAGYMVGDVTTQFMIKSGDVVNVSGAATLKRGFYCKAKGSL